MNQSIYLLPLRQAAFMVVVMVFSIICLFIDQLFFPGWVSAATWGIGFSFIYALYAWGTNDRLIQRFFIFSLSAGIAELFADAWLVQYTETLVYPQGGIMLASSPFYMPFSWVVVLMQLGYISFWLHRKLSLPVVCLLMVLLSGLMIPLYEFWAIKAGWWHYKGTPMLHQVPVYIFVAEGLLALGIPVFIQRIKGVRLLFVILFGILQGGVMLLTCMLAYFLFG